jgi:glycogen debranching enzyme
VRADERGLPALVEQSLDDLDALRLVLPGDRGAQFLAAGSPWFLTLFGRDSLWAARMALPLGTTLAGGTLAVLASRQGRVDDPATGEAPGKVLHELRRAAFGFGEPGLGGEVHLPPVYYGTVDATLLWVVLLHDAWRWGLDPAAVRALLPALEAAAGWMTGPAADPDGDGFLEYVDTSGTGLSNQGWKDSGDALRFRDGSLARGPVALAEVQGYAYEAAGCAAALLTAFDRPGADALLQWQADLGERFRAAFWVDDTAGAYPALALDGDKRRVDALTSNPGHLLGTGLLTREEAGLVAHRIAGDGLDSGFGLRTMASTDGGYSPLSYHCGSVWPHDTAIAVTGLVREGFGAEAARLVRGLLGAAPAFEQRLPELFAGDASADVRVPVPYPAACRPQAWAAAAGVSLLRDLLGLSVDVPAGVLRLDPLPHGPAGALRVEGLTVGGGTLDVELDRDGAVLAASTTSGLQVDRPA